MMFAVNIILAWSWQHHIIAKRELDEGCLFIAVSSIGKMIFPFPFRPCKIIQVISLVTSKSKSYQKC